MEGIKGHRWGLSFVSLFLFLVLVFFAGSSYSEATVEIHPDKLVVHIIPHSHCDPGWLKTYEEYFTDHVDRILSGIVHQLSLDSKKTFIWAEISFFKLWWEKQTIETRNTVKILVEKKQLEFVGGGWVQNDEATAHMDVVVDQITEGHEYLLKYFNVKPRIAWQVDPFGHSSLTPTLFSQAGYEALVINRIHHSLKWNYKSSKDMEFIWRPSQSLGKDGEMFTHVLHTHYAAPIGFDWEEGSMTVSAANLQSRAQDLCNALKERSNSYQTNQLLVPWGDDFKFQNAELQFSNMDQLVQYINSHPEMGVVIKYSTLSNYFDAVKEFSKQKKPKFGVYLGDFFPYADNEDSYWTGYYTSRPQLKIMHREAVSVIRSAEMLYAFARAAFASISVPYSWDRSHQHLSAAHKVTSLVAHHDGVTGTSRARVVSDYMGKLSEGISNSLSVFQETAELLLAKNGNKPDLKVLNPDLILSQPESSKSRVLVLQNSLAWTRVQIFSAKTSQKFVTVLNSDGESVPCQVHQIEAGDKPVFSVDFQATVPALGMATYFLQAADSSSSAKCAIATVEKISSKGASIENHYMRLEFDDRGYISSLFDKGMEESVPFHMKYFEYQTSRSGAYIFRSEGRPPNPIEGPATLTVVKGPILSQVTSQIKHVNYVVRLYTFSEDIPKEHDMGKFMDITHHVSPSAANTEFVVRYSSPLKSNDFYVDNGIEMRGRSPQRNGRAEVDYYPMPSTAFLRDENQQLTVLGKQVTGATSNEAGGLEIMLHRWLGQDDGRGLAEAVVDSSPIASSHTVSFAGITFSEIFRRKMALYLEHPLRALYATSPTTVSSWKNNHFAEFEPVQSFPANLHAFSLKAREMGSEDVVFRVQHIFENDQSGKFVLSHPSSLNLETLFSDFHVPAIKQVALPLTKEILPRYVFPEGEKTLPGYGTVPPPPKLDSNKQNSEEEGVFISKIALEKQEEEQKGRKLLSFEAIGSIEVHPIQIQSFLLQLELKEERLPIFQAKIAKNSDFQSNVEQNKGLEPSKEEEETEDYVKQPNPEPKEHKEPPNVKFPFDESETTKMHPNDSDETFKSETLTRSEIQIFVVVTVIGIILIIVVYLQINSYRTKSTKRKPGIGKPAV